MSCDEVRPLLDDHAAGRLSRSWRARAERHLAGCDPCRQELAAVARLRRAVAALPAERLPRRDLWPGIAAELRARPRRSEAPSAWWRGVAAMLVVAGGLVVAVTLRPAPPSAAPGEALRGQALSRMALPGAPEAARAASELRHADGVLHSYRDLVEAVERRRLRQPAAEAALAAGLAEIERATAEVEAAVAARPADRRLRLALAAAYRRESAWAARLARS